MAGVQKIGPCPPSPLPGSRSCGPGVLVGLRGTLGAAKTQLSPSLVPDPGPRSFLLPGRSPLCAKESAFIVVMTLFPNSLLRQQCNPVVKTHDTLWTFTDRS